MDKKKEEETKKPKKRPEKYDSKLSINGSFDDVIKVSLIKPEEKAKK